MTPSPRDPRALISERTLHRLEAWSQTARPFETGGLLIGVLTRAGPWVTEAEEIPADPPSAHRFRIPRGVTTGIVSRYQAIDPRLGYLGDWHSHVADVGPSATDLSTLASLASCATRRRRRLLAVVRRQEEGWNLEFWIQTRLHLPRRCSQVLTGPLRGRAEIPQKD
jgi:hypothetical protein